MKNVLLFLMLFCSSFFAISQGNPPSTFKVKGQVIDSLKKSIPFATVTLYKLPEKTVKKRLATDVDGKFLINMQSPGKYLLTISSVGFEMYSKSLETQANDVIELGKIMVKESTHSIGEIQIMAEKPLVKVDIDKITYSSENDPDAKTATTLDMLRKVPMVTVDGEDNIQLKGASNFKVFINGKPSTMLTNNAKDVLKSMPATMVKDIEIITSPGAKYDAEGIGGIINIITQKKTMQGYNGTINASANTQGNYNSSLYLAVTNGKFGFSTNLSGFYNQSPSLSSITNRTNYTSTNDRYLNSTGSNSNHGLYPWGNGDASYEIDSLNLISASFNFWHQEYKSESQSVIDILSDQRIRTQAYEMSSTNKGTYGGPETNLDYQHTFKKNKEQIFTLSYKLNYSPTSSEGKSKIDEILNFPNLQQKSNNEAYSAEHTIQADYVHPLTKLQKIETGIKSIIRINSSTTDYYMFQNNEFVADPNRKSDFDYTQYIYAGYLSYNLKYKKFGLKTGVRVENTTTNGTISSKKETSFENDYIEYVPSASISYQMKPTQSLRASYNMRIQRPGIWYLNPYVNDIDPKNISYGNPNLNPEKVHSFDLNFSQFAKVTNINLSTFYSFSKNAIDRVTTVRNDTSTSTFENIAQNWSLGLSLNGSVRFGTKFSINVNGSVNYKEIKSIQDANMNNSGWGGNASMSTQYTIGKGFRVSGYGGLFMPSVRLQSKNSPFYYLNLNINKELLNKKMTVSFSVQNIFWDKMKFTNEMNGVNFYQKSQNYRPGRSFGLNISYKFGEMNNQIKKAQRGIRNDDVKSGEGGNSGGGGGGN